MMSHQAAARDFEALKKTLTFSVRIVAFITVPAALGLMILREPIIRVLFQHGQFVAESTRLTARALLYYAIGLPALASVKLIVPAFYSTRDTRTPVMVGGISLMINLVLNIAFLQFFFKRVQNGGPALATAIACFFDFFALYHHLPVAVRCVGNDGNPAFFLKDFPVRRDNGRSLLVWQSLHGVCDAFGVPGATLDIHRTFRWAHRPVSGPGVELPRPWSACALWIGF